MRKNKNTHASQKAGGSRKLKRAVRGSTQKKHSGKTQAKKSQTRKAASVKALPKRASAPRTAQQYSKLSEASQEKWNRVTHVVSKMRAEKLSLKQASKEFGVDPRTVARLAKSALRKDSKGRLVAKGEDRLLRMLVMPGTNGLIEVAVKDSKQASLIGKYSDAVQKYLRSGDTTTLKKFTRKRIKTTDGKIIRFLTDPEELTRQGSAGVLSFESLYAR